MNKKVFKIGDPGKYDKVFGIMEQHHEFLSEPLYILVWLDTLSQVEMTGAFFCPKQAEEYTKSHREKMIEKEIENILLT